MLNKEKSSKTTDKRLKSKDQGHFSADYFLHPFPVAKILTTRQ